MSSDPIEADLGDAIIGEEDPMVMTIHPSDAWANWRMKLANQMFNEWQASRNNES